MSISSRQTNKKVVLGALAALATLAPSASDAMGFRASPGAIRATPAISSISRVSPAATSAIMKRVNGGVVRADYQFDSTIHPWPESNPFVQAPSFPDRVGSATTRLLPAGNVASAFRQFQR